VTQPGALLEVLAAHFRSWSKNTLRQRLRLGCITINGTAADRADIELHAGDRVEIHQQAAGRLPKTASTLPVLFDDDDLFAIDKPVGLLSVSSDDQRQRTALVMAREAAGRPGQPVPLWPVHRLDRETSGVLLFARSAAVRDRVQADWTNTEKVYAAIVEGCPATANGTIDQPLWQDRNLRVHVGPRQDAKAARTHYRVVQRGGSRSRLEVTIDTGRKHQIRAHLAWLGHPIVGDDRYGQRDARLCLHAERLVLRHPTLGEPLLLVAPVPAALSRALSSAP
jgi:23S rRNA pseudouridine1911/1915/1917 synthase